MLIAPNIERILGTPDARKHLGVDVKSGQLILKTPEEKAIARLAIMVSDVANRSIKVSHLDTKEQRVEYAKGVASRPLLEPATGAASQLVATIPGAGPSADVKRISPYRGTLIPRQFKLAIPQPRINRIYYELQRLKVETFVNCCAVMLRVFVELSVDDFAQRRGISLKVSAKPKSSASGTQQPQAKDKDMTLREKLRTIARYLESHDICTQAELKGVRALIANRDHVLSVDSLHAYVHNKDYSPTPTDLKTTWDNLQVFIERIWTI